MLSGGPARCWSNFLNTGQCEKLNDADDYRLLKKNISTSAEEKL